jgi:hypothetical protein
VGLAIVRNDGLGAAELARRSWGAGDRDAELLVAVPGDEAIVLGAFQRSSEVAGGGVVLVRRGSGGPAVRVGPGSVWVQLHLARPDVLVACDGARLVNRYVRPILRAIGAKYFGRDWISVDHRPAGLVAFAHDARTGRSLFEAIVAARTPFALGPRASYLGKEPIVLESDPAEIADAIAEAYAALAKDSERIAIGAPAGGERRVIDEPPWKAVREDAIGIVAAGPDREGKMRVGGEFMASRDAIADLEARLANGEAAASAVEAALASPNAVLFGARAETITGVILEASL